MRIRSGLIAALVLASGLALAAPAAATTAPTATAPTGAAPAAIPTATHFNGIPSVGTLAHKANGSDHFCSASVVASPHEDLIITAAHCVYGATGVVFIPGYHQGAEPYGAWTVGSIYVDPRWAATRDIDADFAIAVVKPLHGKRLQQVTGADRLLINQPTSERVTIIGYPDLKYDAHNQPISCTARTTKLSGDSGLEFLCHGYYDGTSGSPWLVGYNPKTRTGDINGVIGGWDQGGPNEYTSSTSYFGTDVRNLYDTAVAHS